MNFIHRILPSISIFTILLFLLASCITPKKVDRWVKEQYAGSVTAKPRSSDYISVKNTASPAGPEFSRTEKRKAKVLPILLYWKWKIGTHTVLEPTIPQWYFTSAVIPYANSKKLKQKLDGQKLELTIDSMPASFSVLDEGWAVFVIFGSIHQEKIYVDPDNREMIVSYRLLRDNIETKKGRVTIPDLNQAMNFKMFKSGKKSFLAYLEKYNANIQAMGKEVIDKIISEL